MEQSIKISVKQGFVVPNCFKGDVSIEVGIVVFWLGNRMRIKSVVLNLSSFSFFSLCAQLYDAKFSNLNCFGLIWPHKDWSLLRRRKFDVVAKLKKIDPYLIVREHFIFLSLGFEAIERCYRGDMMKGVWNSVILTSLRDVLRLRLSRDRFILIGVCVTGFINFELDHWGTGKEERVSDSFTFSVPLPLHRCLFSLGVK